MSKTAAKLSDAEPDEYRTASDGKIYCMNNPDTPLKNNTDSVIDPAVGTVTELVDLGKSGGARSFFDQDGSVWFFAKTGVVNVETKLYRISGSVAEEVAVPGLRRRYTDSAVVFDGSVFNAWSPRTRRGRQRQTDAFRPEHA